MSNPNNTTPERSYKLPLLLFVAIAGYFLWTEHRAHVIEFLPYAFLFACVGIHFFMHGSHGSHGGHDDHEHLSDEGSNRENISATQLTHQSASDGSETDRSKQS